MRRRKLVQRTFGLLVAIAVSAGGPSAEVMRWHPEEFGPVREARAIALEPGELRIVTMNAWRMASIARVPALLDAIDATGAAMGTSERAHPELVAIQEIQSHQASTEIARRDRGEGTHVQACVCSLRGDGSVREAVMAISHTPVVARSSECIDLGSIFPDHERCAALIRGEVDGRPIDFVATHLAWSTDPTPMVETLARELARRGALGPHTVVAGDLNAVPGSSAYAAMLATGLRDARPGAPPTHFLGLRLDYVLAGEAWAAVRGVDRRASYELVRPVARLTLPSECATGGPPGCGISDHLPEAVVLRAR